MKRIITVLLLTAMLISCVIAFPACSKKSEGTLRVGMECNYPPFNWTQTEQTDGTVPISGDVTFAGGYDIAIAQKIADGLNMDLEVVKLDWDSLLVSVETGVIDLIIAGMSPTAERMENIDFSNAYYTSELVIIVKKDSKYASATSLADFDGATIVAQIGTVHDTVIDQIPNVIHKDAMADFSQMRIALDSGIVDGYVAEKPEALSIAKTDLGFTSVEFAEGKGFTVTPDQVDVSVGIAKGNDERLAKINEILAGITADERVQMMADAVANQPQG
jgi:ABC-type amino acid transport/signal transduction systems, periplasmic component/domain